MTDDKGYIAEHMREHSELYRQQHTGYAMPVSLGGGTMIGNDELAELRRKAAAFDGMVKYELVIYSYPPFPSISYELRHECKNHTGGSFGPTPLDAAERAIAANEKRAVQFINHPTSEVITAGATS